MVVLWWQSLANIVCILEETETLVPPTAEFQFLTFSDCDLSLNMICLLLEKTGEILKTKKSTATPVLDFWWRLPCVSKAGWIPRLRAWMGGWMDGWVDGCGHVKSIKNQ